MYAWIWRHLPFGLRGKIAGSVLLVLGFAALLWFVVFPVVEPNLPINDGQINDTDTGGQPTPLPSGTVRPSGAAGSTGASRSGAPGQGSLPGDDATPTRTPSPSSRRSR